ncbi:MAG TPA: hypothetical protein VGK14_13575 [Novimethylophilus sp.]|jgi:hypothetical protein|uniref:hypothetical protein n=1 Tax=Novimethylophilus sp. TaxID=2137426 RepID=UPI002F4164BF
MTTRILSADLYIAPEVWVPELEGLILQALPRIENNDRLVGELTNKLKTAVEYFLVAYRQTAYLADHFNNHSPAQVLQIVEGIQAYKTLADECVKGKKTLKRAFDLWIANMDIEDGTTKTVH